MKEDSFEIRPEPSHALVCIGFSGDFWDMDVADRFRTEVQAAVSSLRCAPGAHLVLVDLRNAVLQSKDVFGKMQALVGSSIAARIALVAESPLARMQTRRLQVRENVVLFADMAEARGWLLAPVRSAA